MTHHTPDSGRAPGMPDAAAPEKVADHDNLQAQELPRDPIMAACRLRDMLAPSKTVDQQRAHDAACHLVARLVTTLPASGPLPKLGPALVERNALSDAVHAAYSLSSLAGGLGALHDNLPLGLPPDSGPAEQRAADALAELIGVVIERAEALARRLDRLSMECR